MTISMHRRMFSLFATTLLAAPELLAAPQTQGGTPIPVGTPYNEITPQIPADKKTVRLLFSYECNHCRNYHNGIHAWGKTLPKPIRFAATPIITDANNQSILHAVYGRLMAGMIAPKALLPYDMLIYNRIQGDPYNSAPSSGAITLDDTLKILVQSGIPFKQIDLFIKEGKTALIEKQLPFHAQVIRTYGLKETPSIAIAGKYLVTPDHTGGNPQQFVGLLNGIVSRVIEQGASS